ncbi:MULTISPECIES: helix-turn-helix domain-containing protein [unclassified Paenibacillus]|uniref:helix-turn-helix domain-containing protein n=1 Tax=unclassified Paenibacillus TaxID=185978 RepID=UPI0004F5AC9F|nr:helix-turn-helix domain-containing protein [Paenibacillus sp. FSL P4-0081]AIQ29264.1 hypothetical protein P40081_14675 [Paenibacillus sp. FSL P4-0081]
MKNQITILGAALILGLSLIASSLIISNERASSNEKAMETQIAQLQTEAKEQAELLEQTVSTAAESPLMTMSEAAEFLHLTENEVLNIIKAEHEVLKYNGSLTGIPYMKVDEQFMINRAELQNWVQQATLEKRVYMGTKITNR